MEPANECVNEKPRVKNGNDDFRNKIYRHIYINNGNHTFYYFSEKKGNNKNLWWGLNSRVSHDWQLTSQMCYPLPHIWRSLHFFYSYIRINFLRRAKSKTNTPGNSLTNYRLSDWRSGKALASNHCDKGSIPGVECEMVMWSPSQTGGFPPGTPVSSHTKTTGTKTSLQRVWYIWVYIIGTCFVIVLKQILFIV